MPVKLTAEHYKVIAGAVLVSALSLAVTLRYFHRSFPEASLDLSVNREESARIAAVFLRARGLQLDGYRHAAAFDYDENAKLYIERTQGLERMNVLARGPVHLWRWSHRWFQPLQQEEIQAEVTTKGEIARFSHLIPESRPGANLEPDQARAIAEKFLTEVMHRDLAGLEYLDASSVKRPARTDYSFTWQVKTVDLGQGSLRIAVSLNGGEVGGYDEFVKVPDQWKREYAQLRSRNETVQIIDEVFFILLGIGMLVMLLLRIRDHDVPVRTAAAFGVVGGLLYLGSELNSFPLAEFSYDTTDPYSSFVSFYLLRAALSAGGIGVSLFLLVAAAEPVYREAFPEKLSFRRHFTWQGLRTRSFLMANVVGIALAFFFFGYQTVFYLVANKLGAWSPSDLPFTNDLNTRLPWLSVLFMGFFLAVSEEMQFRAFAIPFLRKLFRSLPVAVVLAAFNWGFLHAAYPNQPFYIRGLEVGIGGIITGVVMLRFGILATLIWHYSVDALYTAFVLLRSHDPYLMISGAITAGIMLAPLTVAIVAYLRAGTFADESALSNEQEGIRRESTATAPAAEPSGAAYVPLAREQLARAAVLIVILVALAAIPVYKFAEGYRIGVTAREASAAGDAYLERHGISPGAYHRVAMLRGNVDVMTLRYFMEHMPLRDADQLYRRSTQLAVWEVRYFRSLEKEEHQVYFDAGSGKFVDHRRTPAEDAAGPSLPLESALAQAQNAFPEHGYDLNDFELQDSRAIKRPNRQDYSFTWQVKPGDFRNVAGAHYRVQAEVAGDQIISFSDYFKLPEEWVREQEKQPTVRTLLGAAVTLLLIIVAACVVALFVTKLRAGALRWRSALPVAIAIFCLNLVVLGNRLPLADASYSTSIPLSTFHLQSAVLQLAGALLSGCAALLLAAFVLGLYPEAELACKGRWNAFWQRDAAVAAALLAAGAGALGNIKAMLFRLPGIHRPLVPDFAPAYLATWFPAIDVLAGATISALFASAAFALLIALFESSRQRTKFLWSAALLIGIVAASGSRAQSLPEFLITAGTDLLAAAAVFWLGRNYFRNNPLAYVVAVFAVIAGNAAWQLLAQRNRFYMLNGAVVGAALVAMFGWMLLGGTSRASATPISSGATPGATPSGAVFPSRSISSGSQER